MAEIDMSLCAKLRGIPRSTSLKFLRLCLGSENLEIVGRVNLKGDRNMANAFVRDKSGKSLCELKGTDVLPGLRDWWEQFSGRIFSTNGTVVPAMNPNNKSHGTPPCDPQQQKRNDSPVVLVLAFDHTGNPAKASPDLVDEVLRAVRRVSHCTHPMVGLMRKIPHAPRKPNSGGELYVEMPSKDEAKRLVDNLLLDAYPICVNDCRYYLHATQRLAKDKVYATNQKGSIVKELPGVVADDDYMMPPTANGYPQANFRQYPDEEFVSHMSWCMPLPMFVLGHCDVPTQEATSDSDEERAPVSPSSSGISGSTTSLPETPPATWSHNPYPGL